MRLSASGAQKTRQESKKLGGYSKCWSPGDTLRVFYPIFWDGNVVDFAVGAVWGHSVNDIKGLGLKTGFIPSLMNIDDEGNIIGPPDITYQFSKIAGVFVRGRYAKEEAHIQQKKFATESARKDALKALEAEYDTQNNPDAVKPIIGPLKYLITTEVLSYKIANDAPVKDSVALSSAPLSDTVINKISAVLNNKQFKPEPGAYFLEVEWVYPTDPKKSKSGKDATCSGLTAEYQTINRFPDFWPEIEVRLKNMAVDAEVIAKRATRKVDEKKIFTALLNYSYVNAEDLDSCSEDDEDMLLSQAWLLREMNITRGLSNQTLIDKINTKFEELKTQESEQMPSPENVASLSNNVAEPAGMPDLSANLGTPASAQGAAPMPDLAANLGSTAQNATVPDLSANLGAAAQPVAPTSPLDQVASMPDLSAAIPVRNSAAPTIDSLMQSDKAIHITTEQEEDINLDLV